MDSNTPNKNVTNDVDIPPEASEPEKDNMGDERNEIRRPKKIHKLSLKVTEDFNKKLKKRGVIYIARVPPRMTPSKLKSLLSDFGEVTRIFLVEEDASKRKRRRKEFGNSGGKRYVEGWIEFSNKRKAKHVAQSLNLSPISNFKRNPHYGTLWNLRYLHKFRWSHLTEKVAYERRVREQKLKVEMMQARRENAAYVEMVETGKKLDKIEERKRKRNGGETIGYGQKKNGSGKRKYYQKQTLSTDTMGKPANLTVLEGLL